MELVSSQVLSSNGSGTKNMSSLLSLSLTHTLSYLQYLTLQSFLLLLWEFLLECILRHIFKLYVYRNLHNEVIVQG